METLETIGPRLSGKEWSKLTAVLAARIALYFAVLKQLVQEWQNNPNFSHGFRIPPLVAFLVWVRRDAIKRLPLRPSNLGLFGLSISLGILILGNFGVELFLTRFSFLAVLASLVVYLLGWRSLQGDRSPTCFLLVSVPRPCGRTEYRAKAYLVADAIQLNRTDDALARISVPLLGREVDGEKTAQEFIHEMYPLLA